MAGSLFVGAEEVILRADKEHYGSSRPIMEGLELVTVLRKFPTSRVVIHCHTQDDTSAEFFCKVNGLSEVRVVTTPVVDQFLEPAAAQWHVFQRERSKGPINLVLTSYPQMWTRCKRAHQQVLLYARLGAVGLAPQIQTWEELEESVRKQREAKVEGSNSAA